MDAALERVWARWCASRVLHLWDAPEVVRTWLDTGEDGIEVEADLYLRWPAPPLIPASAVHASLAAEDAMSGSDPSYRARAAAGAAVLGVYPGPQGRSTHGHSGQERAKRAELRAQQHARALIASLSALLPAHGLEALRTPEAEEDPWLTREVWRVVMERDVEVQVPVQHDDGTTTYRTEVVRTIVDWEAAKAWCDWMIEAKRRDAAAQHEEEMA